MDLFGGREGRGGEGRVGEGRGGREGRRRGGCGERGEGGRGREGGEGGKRQLICCVTSLIGMFNSNPMIPQNLNNNLT